MVYKLASLILNPEQNNGTVGEIFITQPEKEKEDLAGRLFVLAEIKSDKAESLKILNFITNSANRNYYQNEKIILREKIKSLKIEHIFEAALTKINKELSTFLKEEKIKVKLTDLNLTIGVAEKDEIHFSTTGKNKALLIFKSKEKKPIGYQRYQKSEPEVQKYKLVGVTKDEDNEKPSLDKIFSNVISGKIPEEGYFVFSNEALPEYISGDKLISIITKLPPNSAAEQIKNTLAETNNYITFLALIIKNASGSYSPEKQAIQEKSLLPNTAHASISNLNMSERKTERLLSTPGIISPIMPALDKNGNEKRETPKKEPSKLLKFDIKDKIFFKRKDTWTSIVNSAKKILTVIFFVFGLIVMGVQNLTDKGKWKKAYTTITQIPNIILGGFLALKNLSLKNKALLVTSLALILALSYNIRSQNIKNQEEKKNKVVTDILGKIEQKQGQIDGSLLYNNEGAAKETLKEVEVLLADLSNSAGNQNENYLKIKRRNDEQLNKLRHLFKPSGLTKLQDFRAAGINTKMSTIFWSNNKLCISGQNDSKVYLLDPTNKNLENSDSHLDTTNNSFVNPTGEEERVYYFFNNKVVKLDSNKKEFTPIKGENVLENPIKSAKVYGNWLYSIGGKGDQIYKYSLKNNEISQKKDWLKNKENTSEFVDFTIDGSIYLLKENGQVAKYLKGEKQAFETEIADPAINKAKKISIPEGSSYIYILETEKNRLVEFKKGDGKFVVQYDLSEISVLDFSIDEKNKTLYLLTEDAVYQAKLDK